MKNVIKVWRDPDTGLLFKTTRYAPSSACYVVTYLAYQGGYINTSPRRVSVDELRAFTRGLERVYNPPPLAV